MRIKILGSAAGGGLPQWNCSCHNCAASRSALGSVKPRTQTQLAISVDDKHWFLLNASPDLLSQIQSTSELHSCAANGARQSPIVGVVLTSADIDCILGLLHLREMQPLQIYATRAVQQIVREENSMFRMLEQSPAQACWNRFSAGEEFELMTSRGIGGGIFVRAIPTGGSHPYYVEVSGWMSAIDAEATVGLVVRSDDYKFLFLPGTPTIGEQLMNEMKECDLVFLDGTFWSDDELIRTQGGGRTALQMGHMPVSGPEGSLQRLQRLTGPRKIFIHLNNTNPMLNEASLEHRAVKAAGWEIAEDGWEIAPIAEVASTS